MSFKTYLLAAALLLFPTLAHTQTQTIYSKTFYGDGTGLYVNHSTTTGCSLSGNCNVALGGPDPLPILVNPWEAVSINILCVQIAFLPDAPVNTATYMFAGNSFSPDIMVWGAPSASGVTGMCYPSGTAFPFPAAAPVGTANGPGQNNFTLPHLDVHLQGGPANTPYNVYLTVYYTKNAQ